MENGKTECFVGALLNVDQEKHEELDAKDKTEQDNLTKLFNRQAEDFFTHCGFLRLDLRSDYEKEPVIGQILSLILSPAFDLFACSMIATKAIPAAKARIAALQAAGFALSKEHVVGHDGRRYGDYFVLKREVAA